MTNILNVGQTDATNYYQSSTQTSTGNSNFDSVLETEITIYATPANGSQSATSTTNSVTAPEELDSIFKAAAAQYNISENLLKAVAKAESNFNASATSGAGAMGIMQLMPATASSLGVTNAYDAKENIFGGAKYLSQLLTKYNGNTSLALAAYNAGPGNVDKYNGIPPFAETQNYVQKVLAYAGTTITSDDIVYASASTGNSAQTDTSVTTIYAVAASDATNPARMNL